MRSDAAQSPSGRSSGGVASTVVRRPCTLPATARASASVSPTAQPPRPSGTATSASAGAVSSAKPPCPSATSGPTTCGPAALEGGARRALPPGHGEPAWSSPVATSQASRIVRQPVHRQRWASSACSTASWSPGCGALGPGPSSRQMIPGVQKPHWLAPVAQNASAQRPARRAGARRGWSPIVRPRAATGVTQATRGCPSTSTVQHPHWPCGLQPSFGERRPSVVAQHVEQRGRRRRGPRPAGRRPPAAGWVADLGRPWAEDRFAAMSPRTLAPGISPARSSSAAVPRPVPCCSERAAATTPAVGPRPPTATSTGDLSLVQFFGGLPMLVAGGPVRAPFGVADTEDLLPIDATPGSLTVTLTGPNGEAVGEPIEVDRHAEGLPRGLLPAAVHGRRSRHLHRPHRDRRRGRWRWRSRSTPPRTWRSSRSARRCPRSSRPPPTDAQGVDPICTDDPVCPLHDVTVAEALDAGRPIALLVATPAFCQITICGPVLDVLLAVADDYPDVQLVHAEVYAHPQEDLEVKAAVVDELGLTFEPCLVLVGRRRCGGGATRHDLRRGRGRRGAGPPRLSPPVTSGPWIQRPSTNRWHRASTCGPTSSRWPPPSSSPSTSRATCAPPSRRPTRCSPRSPRSRPSLPTGSWWCTG